MKRARDQRTAEIAAIHVGKRLLGLDEETYRQMLWTVARVSSSADLDAHGRRAVIDHMRSRGFAALKPAPAPALDHGREPAFSDDKKPLGGKIKALLVDGGYPWNYARSMAKRMYHVDALEFASSEQLRGIVAALEKDKQRRNRRER